MPRGRSAAVGSGNTDRERVRVSQAGVRYGGCPISVNALVRQGTDFALDFPDQA